MRHIIFYLLILPLNAFCQRSDYPALVRENAIARPDSAVSYASTGIRESEKMGDRREEALILLELGKLNFARNHFDLARKFFNDALGLFRDLKDSAYSALCYDNLGLLDSAEHDQSNAALNFNKVLNIYSLNQDTAHVTTGLINLGHVWAERGFYDKALSYYLKALVHYEQIPKKPKPYYTLLRDISSIYTKKGDETAALKYLRECLQKSAAADLRDTEADMLNDEGLILIKENKTARAMLAFKEALNAAKKNKLPKAQAQALINMAGLLKRDKASGSLQDLKKALIIVNRLDEPRLKAYIYQAMAGIYRQEQNYKEAMSLLNEHQLLVDSMLKADTTRDMMALDSSYRLERSLEEVSGLRRVNELEKDRINLAFCIIGIIIILLIVLWLYLRQSRHLNAELIASNRVKDTLFSIIGHDLKGPAGSAAQLFELMETEDFTPEEMKLMIHDLRKQTNASLELLQSLLEWGKAQLQGITVKSKSFNPRQVIEHCMDLLSQQAALKHIQVVNDVSANLILTADIDHFELVIRNLLSNAIKFSHEGSAIQLSNTSSSNEAIISIADQGVGISREQQALFDEGKLKVSFGTRQEKGSGLGLMLVKDFVKANHGRIWLSSNEGKGTTFFVALPMANN